MSFYSTIVTLTDMIILYIEVGNIGITYCLGVALCLQ